MVNFDTPCLFIFPGEREVLTGDKLLLLATESCDLLGYGLQSRKKVMAKADIVIKF